LAQAILAQGYFARQGVFKPAQENHPL